MVHQLQATVLIFEGKDLVIVGCMWKDSAAAKWAIPCEETFSCSNVQCNIFPNKSDTVARSKTRVSIFSLLLSKNVRHSILESEKPWFTLIFGWASLSRLCVNDVSKIRSPLEGKLCYLCHLLPIFVNPSAMLFAFCIWCFAVIHTVDSVQDFPLEQILVLVLE